MSTIALDAAKALIDILERKLADAKPCPHVSTSGEGTSYCTLAEEGMRRLQAENEALRSAISAPKDEIAWLMACKSHDGRLIGWLGLWDNEDYGWTLDPNKVIRFARQEDADMMLSNWEVEDSCHLTSEEHIWL